MRSVNYKNILILKHFTEHLKPGYQIGNDIPLSLLNPGEIVENFEFATWFSKYDFVS